MEFKRLNPLTGELASSAFAMSVGEVETIADLAARAFPTGYGRFGGKAGIDQFTELRWVTVQSGLGHYPF